MILQLKCNFWSWITYFITYFQVGCFGYIAFYDDEITGDVLMNFRPTFFSELIKLGFVMSTVISFPLVIFPCRASIYTLLFAPVSVTVRFFAYVMHHKAYSGPILASAKVNWKKITLAREVHDFLRSFMQSCRAAWMTATEGFSLTSLMPISLGLRDGDDLYTCAQISH